MELELGLKITHTRDDITSFTDLRISKDHSGPLFVSRETDSKFILIAYLKGFRRENVGIKINREGNQLEISGEKPVQEMVMMGLIVYKKDVELRTFRKVFRIPGAVVLDRIKAKFNDDEAVLTIFIPKSEKGIRGVSIEEVTDEFEVGGSSIEDSREIPDAELHGNAETGQVPEKEDDGIGPEVMNPKPEEIPSPKDSTNSSEEEEQEDQGQVKEEVVGPIEEELSSESMSESKKEEKTEMEEKLGSDEAEESKEEIIERKPERSEMVEPEKAENEAREGVPEREPEENKVEAHMDETGLQEHKSEKQEPKTNMEGTEATVANALDQGKGESSDQSNDKDVSKKSKMCRPVVVAAGSSILVSIIVIVIGLVRSRRKKVQSCQF